MFGDNVFINIIIIIIIIFISFFKMGYNEVT